MNIVLDIADEAAVVGAIKKIVDTWGRIDIAINNAGIGGEISPSPKISSEQFRGVLDINLIGLWVSQREEIKQMLRQDPVEIR